MTKQEKLNYIFRAIKKAHPKRKLVFCDGSTDAKIMIIGEAPGKDEEIQGKPFVGRAGKLLNATLEKLGWQRSDFYVSNIVKYRPQDARGGTLTPTDEEIAKFRPAIEKEIEVVNPRLIVVLGRIAMLGMGIDGTMAANHGKVLHPPPFLKNGTSHYAKASRDKSDGQEKMRPKILITYHPAAILRNINWESTFREDLEKIRELIG